MFINVNWDSVETSGVNLGWGFSLCLTNENNFCLEMLVLPKVYTLAIIQKNCLKFESRNIIHILYPDKGNEILCISILSTLLRSYIRRKTRQLLSKTVLFLIVFSFQFPSLIVICIFICSCCVDETFIFLFCRFWLAVQSTGLHSNDYLYWILLSGERQDCQAVRPEQPLSMIERKRFSRVGKHAQNKLWCSGWENDGGVWEGGLKRNLSKCHLVSSVAFSLS